LFGEYGIFTCIFVDPAAKGRKLERTKERGERNQARKERNRKRASKRRAGGEYETDSNMSGSSGNNDHVAKSRPGSGRHLENLRIDGGFPGCRNIRDWDIYVSTQCYNAAGHTDKLEFAWLERILKIPDSRSMSLAIVPDEMADLDKMLLRALRREEWLPKDLARDIMKLEKQLLKLVPLRTVTGQLLFYLIHRQIRTMPTYCYQTSVRQLWMIEWAGDRPDEMKSFLATWDYILEEMNPNEVPLETTLTELFTDQFSKVRTYGTRLAILEKTRFG
jgi:hypothetical protein